jgi:poly(A) polymerase
MNSASKNYLQVLLALAAKKNVELYLVGGTIRDHLLGKAYSDFDFTAKEIQPLAKQFALETRSPCIPLDSTPGRNTFRVIVQKEFHFDFTDMQGKSIEEDMAQRDFSINAMSMRLTHFLSGNETVIDPHLGQTDLRNKIIRVIPGPTFSDDPLRLLRAFRFASVLEFSITEETTRQIELEAFQITKTAQERIYSEWLLFLSGKQVFELLELMAQTGLLQCTFPEIAELQSTSATNNDGKISLLHIFNRLEELLTVPETINPSLKLADFLTGRQKSLLKFSALLHRLNPTFSEASSNYRIKIDEESAIVRLLKRLTASNVDIRFIFRTIQCQQEAMKSNLAFAGTSINESALYRFTKKYDAELMAGIFLARAVQSATEKDRETQLFLQAAHRVTEFYFQRYLPALENEVLLTGDDLINDFKLTPSPLFQLILDEVEEGRVLGTIRTKNQAATIAQQIIATHNTRQET